MVKDDLWTRCVCKGDIVTVAAELSREQTQCERVKNELHKKFEDASSTTAQLEAKMEKLRQNYTEKSQVNDGFFNLTYYCSLFEMTYSILLKTQMSWKSSKWQNVNK